MYPVPEPMEHQQRMGLAQMIAERLIARYGKLVKAIGLYGSLARNEDGPYSDIEMFCVVRAPGETCNYEWCAGPWKAEVNVRDEASLRQEASQVAGHWARTHGKFVHIFPLTDPEDYFSGLRELVVSHPPELYREVIEEVLIGDMYELIGKVRNAQVRGHDQALVVLAVELVQRTASALGLEHRHLYGTSSSVLDEPVSQFHIIFLWSARTGSLLSVPTVANGSVYVGAIDGYLYALNSSNGKQLWRYQIGDAVWSPTVE